MPESILHSEKVLSKVNFEALRLHPGVALQIQSLASEVHHNVKYIGTIIVRSIIVTMPIVNGKRIWVQVGQGYIIRGFNGMHAFAFESLAIMPRAHPFPYLHFAYPLSVESRKVRNSLRVKTDLSATITFLSDKHSIPVSIVDLSTSGTKVDSQIPLGNSGEAIFLEFEVAFEEISAKLKIPAIIRGHNESEVNHNLRTGIEFKNVSHNDDLILRCFVHTIETGIGKYFYTPPST